MDLATLHRYLGSLPGARATEAEQPCRRALSILEAFPPDLHAAGEYRYSLAAVYSALGTALHSQRPGEAEDAFHRSIDLGTKLVADFPESVSYRRGLADSHYGLGKSLEMVHRTAEAEIAYREAIAVLRQSSFVGSPSLSIESVAPYLRLVRLFEATGRMDEALETCRQVVPIIEKHVRQFPYSLGLWELLHDYYRIVARVQEKVGAADELRSVHRKALDVFAEYVAELPDRPNELEPTVAIAACVGGLLLEGGQQRERVEAYRHMSKIVEQLASRRPGNSDIRSLAGYWKAISGSVLASADRGIEAECAFRHAEIHFRAGADAGPNNASLLNNWAWVLATCPDERLRDPIRGLALAQRAVELAPRGGDNWNTLGVAQYRAGDWHSTVRALEKAMTLFSTRPENSNLESFSTFFLAMAHWHMGEKEKAQQWYDRAVRWMEKHLPRDEELRRFRAEATALLGIAKKD
jgi:tetratricopeptide (TPR) repeat protein